MNNDHEERLNDDRRVIDPSTRRHFVKVLPDLRPQEPIPPATPIEHITDDLSFSFDEQSVHDHFGEPMPHNEDFPEHQLDYHPGPNFESQDTARENGGYYAAPWQTVERASSPHQGRIPPTYDEFINKRRALQYEQNPSQQAQPAYVRPSSPQAAKKSTSFRCKCIAILILIIILILIGVTVGLVLYFVVFKDFSSSSSHTNHASTSVLPTSTLPPTTTTPYPIKSKLDLYNDLPNLRDGVPFYYNSGVYGFFGADPVLGKLYMLGIVKHFTRDLNFETAKQRGCRKCRVYYSPSNPKSEKELIYCCESDGTDKCKPFCNIKDYSYTLDDISLMESFCGIESTEADMFMCVTKSRVAGSSSCNVAFPKGTKCNTDHPFIGQKAPYANCPQNGPFQPGTFAGICKTENYERDAVYAYLRPQNSTLFVQSGEGSYSATGVAASQLLLTTRSSTANALQITLFTPGDFISVYVLQLAYNRLTFIGRLSPSFQWDSISVATDNTISVFLAKSSNLTVERFNIDF